MFKKLIAEACELLEGAGLPGKLSKKYDRGSRGADSFRTFTKKQTNRARRRSEKKMLDDTPSKMTKGYSHASWPSNPVYTQKLYDKPNAFSSKKAKAESVVAEGGGSRLRKPMRQAANGTGGNDIKAKVFARGDARRSGIDMLRKRQTEPSYHGHSKYDGATDGLSRELKKAKKFAVREDNDTEAPETFTVHHKDGRQVGGPYTTLKRARTAVDKHDMKYGGYAHSVRSSKGRLGL